MSVHAVLDRAADSRELVDYSYVQLQELLEQQDVLGAEE